MSRPAPSDDDYRRILEFRMGLRRYLRWSRSQAVAQGVTSTQHQLLLAVRATDPGEGVTIKEIAESLLLRHHSVVELVDRAEQLGIVQRFPDAADRRVVRVRLTETGAAKLEKITRANFEELDRLAPQLTRLLGRLALDG